MATKIYLGCDLFTEGQRIQAAWIQQQLEEQLQDKISLYNPANNMEINDKEAGFSSGTDILLADYQRLKNSDLLIALMDTQDLGLASEMGIAFEMGIPVFQLYTDIRLTGNDKRDKYEAMATDIFQNDFLYINKLVTALSYVNKKGEAYETPHIYKTKENLVTAVVSYINAQLD